jgi:predicted enzyme related to lactoylglutathione lyase
MKRSIESTTEVLKLPRVVHFEIDAKKPENAIPFYEKVFGWKIEKWKGPVDYWLIMTGKEKDPGIEWGTVEKNGSSTINSQHHRRAFSR